MFAACVQNSGLEMFFYHKRTRSVCAGMTLALCTSADFCQQSQQKSPVSGNFEQNNPVPSNPVISIFDEVTPVPGNQEEKESNGRIQRTSFGGTLAPNTLVSGDTFSVAKPLASGEEGVFIQFPTETVDGNDQMVSFLIY